MNTNTRTVPVHFYKPGDPVWYCHRNNYYSPALNIPAVFIKSNPQTATIDVFNEDGTTRRRYIKWSKIKPRNVEVTYEQTK